MAPQRLILILCLLFVDGLIMEESETSISDHNIAEDEVYEIRFSLIDNVISPEDTTLVDGNYRVSLNKHTVRTVMMLVIASVMIATAIFVMIIVILQRAKEIKNDRATQWQPTRHTAHSSDSTQSTNMQSGEKRVTLQYGATGTGA